MQSELQKVTEKQDMMIPENASALLALLHGKSDSICRLFKKEIIVDKAALSSLHNQMIEKLALHSVLASCTSLDVTLKDKNILSFKSWSDFEGYNFSTVNSAVKSIFIQWDFFVQLAGYNVPQRHTVSVRIASTPAPSDVFKVLLSGGFDQADDIDIQSCTMICKVDFINNALAEELVNVAAKWNELCESAYAKKGKLRPCLFKHREFFADIMKYSLWITLSFGTAFIIRYLIKRQSIIITNAHLLYMVIWLFPLLSIWKNIGHYVGKKIYNAFGDVMDTHIFSISRGDQKEHERISQKSDVKKELVWFGVNTIVSVLTSFAFLFLE